MDDEILHINEFFVDSDDPNKVHVLLQITEPSSEEEKKKGYYFAIAEIHNASSEYITKLQNIIDEVENRYYETRPSDDFSDFEQVLETVNKETYGLKNKDTSVHMCVGVIKDKELIFSFCGHPEMLLFYQTKEQRHSLMDLIKENIEENEEWEEKRGLFSNLIQGKMSSEDFLFASSPLIKKYFTPDRLLKIIATRPPRQSSEHLKRVLSDLRNGFPFGGIIISFKKLSTNSNGRKTNAGSAKSMERLFDTQKQTSQILSSSIFPKNNRNQENLPEEEKVPNAKIDSTHLKTTKSKPFLENKANIDYGKITLNILTKIGKAIAWLTVFTWNVFYKLIYGLFLIFLAATNIRGRRKEILENWNKGFKNYKTSFERLPLFTKILFIGAIIFAIAFIVSVFYLRYSQQKKEAKTEFTNAVIEIENKISSAESALIYNNDLIAISELQSASQILQNTKCLEEDKCADLQNSIEKISIKVRKIEVVQPELLFDFNTIEGGTGFEKIIKIDNKILNISSASTQIMVYDVLDHSYKILHASIAGNGFNALTVPKENDYALFLYNNKNLIRYDPINNNLKEIEISYPLENVDIKSLIVYNRRLYTLDSQNGEIYKHDTTPAGFARGTSWLSDDVDLKNARSITIDGDVFVLSSNGQITKLTKGQKQEFSALGIDPPLESGDEIWSYTDLENIYILDSKNKRILVLNKQGLLKKQVTSPQFEEITGMIIEEKNNIAYILSNNKLYKIDL